MAEMQRASHRFDYFGVTLGALHSPKSKALAFRIMDEARIFGYQHFEVGNEDINKLVMLDDYAFLRKSREAREAVKARRELYHELGQYAKEKDVNLLCFVFELAHFSETVAAYPEAENLEKDFLWNLLSTRLRELFEEMPELWGIEIYLDEGPACNISMLRSSMPPAERISRLVHSYLQICKKYNKYLIVSTFTNLTRWHEDICAGLRLVKPSQRLMVTQWVCPGDWGHYPIRNPAIGKVGDHREIIFFDWAAENWGQTKIPLCCPQYIKEKWQDALRRSSNIVGMGGWIHWMWHDTCILGTPNEFNLYTSKRLMDNPNIDLNQIWQEWTVERYGKEASKAVISALSRTEKIIFNAFPVCQNWIIEEVPKSVLPSLQWLFGSLWKESLAKWGWNEEYLQNEKMLFYPTEETLKCVLAEKDIAVDECQKALEDLKFARGTDRYGELRDQLEREFQFVKIVRPYIEAFFRLKMWWMSPSSAAKQSVEEMLSKLRKLADETEEKYGVDIWPGNPGRVRDYVEQVKEALATWPTLLRNWMVIGPFHACGEGINKHFPPENEIIFEKKYEGLEGTIGWYETSMRYGPGYLDTESPGAELAQVHWQAEDAVFYMLTHVLAESPGKAQVAIQGTGQHTAWFSRRKIIFIESRSEMNKSVGYINYFGDEHTGVSIGRIKLSRGWNQLLVKIWIPELRCGGRLWGLPGLRIRILNEKGKSYAGLMHCARM